MSVAPTAENLAPLIVAEEASAHHIKVVFRCPVSGDEWAGHAKVDRDPKRPKLEVDAKGGLWGSIKKAFSGLVGAAVPASGFPENRVDFTITPAIMAQARLDAFESVRRNFTWDALHGRWVSARAARDMQPELVTFVQGVQLTNAWDQGVLARMLAEIAAADGTLADGERELFHAFVGAGGGLSIDELLDRPPVSDADLEETTPDARFVLWLLAAAMAATDRELTPRESGLLDRWAAALGVAARDQQRGWDMVKDWIVDQAFDAAYADGKLTRKEHAEVLAIGQSLGVPAERIDRLDTRCRKRRGIV
ncbi:MAG: hypothetical protein IT385_28915 [Deltaproteobacteria bacterium]|nr:hypothetical protein [Deltaproteobacteria bacterium]